MLGIRRRKSTRKQLVEEIHQLTRENRERPRRETERRILLARHRLGMRLLEEAPASPEHPDPAGVTLPLADDLPEFTRADLTPELLRAAILRDGCLLIRELVPRESALELAAQIDRSFVERERVVDQGEAGDPGYYEPFVPEDESVDPGRGWVRAGGGVLAADAPRVAFAMLEAFQEAGLPELVASYLGEPPMITLQKTTLRKADPSVPGAWHQDGHFMGDVRALNLWLSLSRCGDESPGLDIVPRRLDELVTAGDEESFLSYQVSDKVAADAAAPKGVLRPIFEPGDALLFDELFLHQTASDPAMPKPRYAVESWFFGGSAFPEYTPIAV